MPLNLDELPPWALPAGAVGVVVVGLVVLRGRGGGGDTPALTPLPITGQNPALPAGPDFGAMISALGDTFGSALQDQADTFGTALQQQADAQAADQAATRGLVLDVTTQQGQQQATLLGGLATSIAGWFQQLGNQQAAQATANQQQVTALANAQQSLFDKLMAAMSGAHSGGAAAPAQDVSLSLPPPIPPAYTAPAYTAPSNTLPVAIPVALTKTAAWWSDLAARIGGTASVFGSSQTNPQRIAAGIDVGYGFGLPVAYNGAHDELAAHTQPGDYHESAAIKVLRWVANAMAGNPAGNATEAARAAIIRLGADILDTAGVAVDINQDQAGQYLWIGGFDFGPVYPAIVAERRRRRGL